MGAKWVTFPSSEREDESPNKWSWSPINGYLAGVHISVSVWAQQSGSWIIDKDTTHLAGFIFDRAPPSPILPSKEIGRRFSCDKETLGFSVQHRTESSIYTCSVLGWVSIFNIQYRSGRIVPILQSLVNRPLPPFLKIVRLARRAFLPHSVVSFVSQRTYVSKWSLRLLTNPDLSSTVPTSLTIVPHGRTTQCSATSEGPPSSFWAENIEDSLNCQGEATCPRVWLKNLP